MENINKKILEIALKRCPDPSKIEEYLFPEKEELLSPLQLSGILEARDRIISGVNKGEKILIYGDYDADGITSTALLYRALSIIYDQVVYYIPERDGEGYGLNRGALRSIQEQGINLIITVDCGIKSYDLIKEFTNNGIDFIVTDHHTPDDLIPEGIIVNPKYSNQKEFYDLAGVGVAYTLARALGEIYTEITKKDSDLLQLAALGTIADLVNLGIENRKIVRKGIIELNRRPLIGIKSLVKKNNILEINSKTISFLLAPIINSSGRMESPEIALKLLISEDSSESDALAYELIKLNNKRKNIVETIYKEVQKIILENHYFSDPIIIAYKKDWPHGILGIVASKLMNEYNRPIILFAESEDGIYRGSARSLDKYNIFNALKKVQEEIIEFGGHAQAAGLSIYENNLESLRNKLILDIYKELNYEDFYSDLSPDAIIEDLGEINEDLYKDMALLEPFGNGNPEPLFKFDNPVDLKLRKIGKLKDHLRVEITQNRKKINGIYFNYQEYSGEEVESNLIFAVGLNEWKNKVSIQLEIKKILEAEKIHTLKMEQIIYSNLIFSKGNIAKSFTTGERIKYNEVWNILKESKGIIHFKEKNSIIKESENLSFDDISLFDTKKDFPENFRNIKKFLLKGNEVPLFTNALLLKEEIIKNTESYIFIEGFPYESIVFYLKDINPEINIFFVEGTQNKNNLSRELLSKIYLLIKQTFSSPNCLSLSELKTIFTKNGLNNIKIEEIITGIMIFEELGFLEYLLKNSLLEIKINQFAGKNNLENSKLFNITNMK